MKQPKKRKRGGQPKPATERKRNNVTIRLIDDLRTKLEAASRASGRSLSEEAAWRLTMSFLFNHEIQGVAQVQRSLGEVMAEMLTERGWAVGSDDLMRSITQLCPPDAPSTWSIFMPPEQQQWLNEKLQSAQRSEGLDNQPSEGGGDVDTSHSARSTDTAAARTSAEDTK